jgi:cytochrome c biogenesis protein CcmG/thiol:disulfide interchange protein DsbE
MTVRRAVPVLAAGLLVAACSQPVDVTQSAGSAPAGSAAAPTTGSGDVPAQAQAGLPACPASTDAAEVAQGLPPTTLPCLGPGDPVTLSGLRGTPLILNAWASWCGPCRAELPALASFSERAGGDVEVLGLNAIDDGEAAATLWSQLSMPFPSVVDADGATRAPLRWIGLPVTYFVDADGAIVHRHDGAVTEADEWAALAEQHLGVS